MPADGVLSAMSEQETISTLRLQLRTLQARARRASVRAPCARRAQPPPGRPLARESRARPQPSARCPAARSAPHSLQARIGIEQLHQSQRLEQALSEVRLRARAQLYEQGEWLKMWAQRRVDVEQTAARALPLVLDDVDRMTARLASILDGVRIPEEAFRVPGVPGMPELTNLDGGDFAVTVCYRHQSAADSYRTAVFNYTSQDDGRYDALTRRLVKQTLALLQIDPHADAKAREWELRSEHLRAAEKPAAEH